MTRNNINDYDNEIDIFSDDFLNIDLNVNRISEEVDPYGRENGNNEFENENYYRRGNEDNSIVRGIVRNFNQREVPTFFITKLYRTVFQGLPYVNSNIINTFQIYEEWSSDRADEVVVYGEIVDGCIPENNMVRVWGKRKSNGTIVAKKIKNETTNTFLRINHSIERIEIIVLVLVLIAILWGITQINWIGLIIGILTGIINAILKIFSGILPIITNAIAEIMEILMPVIIAAVGFGMIFKGRK